MAKRRQLFTMVPFYILSITFCIALSCIGSKTVTTVIEGAEIPDRTCVVIDAGHGGIDGGAESCTGVPESQINLEIAIRLKDMLHFLGYDTEMLRTEDTSLHTEGTTIAAQKVSDLRQRVSKVNEAEPSLLISIHQNTYSDPQYSGAQVFYSSAEESRLLAQELQHQLITTLNPGSKRKPKKATGIFLMERIQCPGILIECGFLTNVREEALLRNAAYQKKLCAVIGSTVSNWLNTQETY